MTKYFTIIGLVFQLFCFINSTAQTSKVDSLQTLLLDAKYDTSKVDLLLKITEENQYKDNTKALKFAEEALYISQKADYKLGIADSYLKMAALNILSGALDSAFVYANKGRMRFDTADLASLESRGTLFDVIVHEMAHVIGFGTLWTTDFFIAGSQSNYVSGSGRYTGEYALEIYRREFVENATFIPVELGGGAGTANSHWDEPWPGGSSDLMTGYLGPYPISLSDTTVASFADIGYLTTVTHAVSEAATVWLFLFSMGLVVRRHHQRSTGASTRRLQIFQAMSD